MRQNTPEISIMSFDEARFDEERLKHDVSGTFKIWLTLSEQPTPVWTQAFISSFRTRSVKVGLSEDRVVLECPQLPLAQLQPLLRDLASGAELAAERANRACQDALAQEEHERGEEAKYKAIVRSAMAGVQFKHAASRKA